MFGYIVPDKPELKIREYELYRAYYCGICKSMGRRYGQIPRLTLNYDSVFLAMLLDSIHEEKENIKYETCIAHPIKKRNVAFGNKAIDYAADIHLILSYHKLKDDCQDEHSAKAVAGMMLLKGSYKKLMKKYEKQCILLEEYLAELTRLEKENCPSMDQVAEPFAQIMKLIFSAGEGHVVESSSKKELEKDRIAQGSFAEIGYHLGKWIYMIDAYDDLEENKKSGGYNPFLALGECTDLKERATFNLMLYLNKIAENFEILEIKKNKEILENIIYFGMLKKTENVLERNTKNNAKSI